MPFFSIIIPVYNVAPYLRECLDSVLSQTFGDWEAICVDDGSTDESGAILDEYAAKDKRFRVIHKTNGGVSSARNTGLDAARGVWMVFLDGDDMYFANGLGEIANCANKFTGADLILFEMSRSLADHKDTPTDSFLFVLSAENSKSLHREACRIAYKRELIEHNQTGHPLRFESFISTEDVLFAVSAESLSQQIAVSSAIVYYYRARSDSVEHSPPTLRYVHDWLIANTLVFDKLDRIRGLRDLKKENALFKWMKRYLFYTHRYCLFRLPLHEANNEVKYYVELLRRMDERSPYGFFRKSVIAILSACPSIFVAWVLVYAIPAFRNYLGLGVRLRRIIRSFRGPKIRWPCDER